jgi:hypothetical protein
MWVRRLAPTSDRQLTFHEYIYGGSGGAGDLNGDGVQGNDLLYIPRNALDPTEIQYRAVGARTLAQQAHVGYSGTDPRTAVPIVQFTPPAGGEYVIGNFVNNFWRTQLSVRYSF